MITLNTINQLRQNKTHKTGQVFEILSHNEKGLKEQYGGGKFMFIDEPLFIVNKIKNRTKFSFINSTPLSKTLGADVSYGQKIVFRNSKEVGEVIRNASVSQKEYYQRSYQIGDTSLRVLGLSKTKQNDEAYFADDNGVYIRPNYEGFDGQGVYIRILGDKKVITPEMYGVIPNDTIYQFENECSENMQKAFDSFYSLEAHNRYYISKTLIIRRNKSYIFQGYNLMYDMNFDNRFRSVDVFEKSIIYTNQNIDMVHAISNCDFRGVFDTSNALMYSNTVFSMLLAFRHRSNIDIVCVGNILEIEEKPGKSGMRSFKFDGLDQSYNELENGGNGYVTSANINIKTVGGYSILEHTQILDDLGSGIFTNTCSINIEGIYVKKGVWCDAPLSGTKFTGVIQTKANCSAYILEERTKPGFKDFCNKIDSQNGMYGIQVWDYRGNHNTITDPCWLVSGPCDLAFNTKRDLYRPTKGEHFIRNEVSLIAPTQYSPSYGFLDRDSALSKFHLITALNSVWVNFAERASIDIKTYKAPARFNFENALQTADNYSDIEISDNIKIENPDNFGSISKEPPIFNWDINADFDNEFVEIHLTDPNNTGILSIRELGIALDGTCKYLQLIQGGRNEGLIEANELDFHHFRFLKSLNSEVIIRLIGKGYNPRNRSDRKGIVKIADVCAFSINNQELGKNRKFSPSLTTEGGQSIYDNLTFKNNSAPVIEINGKPHKLTYDDNLNAKFIEI